MKKSWIEKRDCEKSFKIKTIDKYFADIPKGSRMLIASPPIIDEYVNSISYGEYDNMGSNYLVGYDWSVGDFTLGFYYSDFDSDAGAASDQDGGYFTISY